MRRETGDGGRRDWRLRRIAPVLLACLLSFGLGLMAASHRPLARQAGAARFWQEDPWPRPEPAGLPSFVALARELQGAVVNLSTARTVKLPRDHPDVRPGPFDQRDPHEFFDPFFGDRQRPFRQRSLGSGFVIHADGYIVTNSHVVEKTDEILVRLSDGKQFTAEVVGRDAKTDLALIRIRAGHPLLAVPLGDSDGLEVGEWVLAIGNPFGFSHSVTAGIVSGKGRVLGSGAYDDYIQTDAAINPGNSGGPLFNTRGEVVGINTAVVPNSRIGFAIPINLAKPVLVQLKDRGQVVRGWLGVVIQQVTADLADSLGLPADEGALVSEVVGDSPAGRAGIRVGDVIVAYGGRRVREVRDLPRLVAAARVGTAVEVQALREGKPRAFQVRVGELREARVVPPPAEGRGSGLTVKDLTPDLARHFRLAEERGLVIAGVEPGGRAEEVGLRPGDLILEVNRKRIRDLDEYRAGLRETRPGGPVLFLVKRGEHTFFFALKGARE